MGVFANVLSLGPGESGTDLRRNLSEKPGLGAWLLERFSRRATEPPRLALVERINLAPRQTVALIEADGQRLLVATSTDGAPSFYALKPAAGRSGARGLRSADVGTDSI